MTVKQKTCFISVYLSVKRQNKWINKAKSNLKSHFCSLCMWARFLFLFEGNMLLCDHHVAPCAVAGHPFLPVTALLGWKQVSHLMFSRLLFFIYFYLFSYFFALILHMALSRIESVLPQVLSPEWVTARGMSKSLMGSRQTHIQEMTFTQKVTIRNCADTSHRGCHHIYLIFFYS